MMDNQIEFGTKAHSNPAVCKGFKSGQLVNLSSCEESSTQGSSLFFTKAMVPSVSHLYGIWGRPDEMIALWIPSRSPMRHGNGDVVLSRLNRHGCLPAMPRTQVSVVMMSHEASVAVNEDGMVIKNRFGPNGCHALSLPKKEGGREAVEAWAQILSEKVQNLRPE